MPILGIDPGPVTSGVVVYDTKARRVVASNAKATHDEVLNLIDDSGASVVVIERPAAMGQIGVGMAGHMLDTAWVAGGFAEYARANGRRSEHVTRREVLRNLGVHTGKGSADSRVRAACIADHGGTAAVGRKASPGPLYGVSSHAWQALGLVLAWMEAQDIGR